MSLNAHHCWAIITPDKEKAYTILTKIKQEHPFPVKQEIMRNNSHIVVFEDYIVVRWLYPCYNIRGYRFHKLWLDKNFKQDFLNQAIYPYLYMKQQEIIWI